MGLSFGWLDNESLLVRVLRKLPTHYDFSRGLVKIYLSDNHDRSTSSAQISLKSVKMAPTKKKTKTGDTLNSRLALVMKSGKVVLGYKSTLKGRFLNTTKSQFVPCHRILIASR